MNFSGNQRRVYLLALALLVLAIALVCAWSLWLRPADTAASPAAPQTRDAEPSAQSEATPAPLDAQTSADAAGEADGGAAKVST
ncbi:MAG: hypothetical protein IJ769_01720, partial [Clostridia bacterium]|nr:hypothetical protein [Clostridia bacterium]